LVAGLGPPPQHALISLLALNGLRVSEATGADIEHLGLERGHRGADDYPQGRQGRHYPAGAAHGHGAGRIVRKTARRAGITKPVEPYTLRHAFITAALDAGVPLRDVQEAASHAAPPDHDAWRGGLDCDLRVLDRGAFCALVAAVAQGC